MLVMQSPFAELYELMETLENVCPHCKVHCSMEDCREGSGTAPRPMQLNGANWSLCASFDLAADCMSVGVEYDCDSKAEYDVTVDTRIKAKCVGANNHKMQPFKLKFTKLFPYKYLGKFTSFKMLLDADHGLIKGDTITIEADIFVRKCAPCSEHGASHAFADKSDITTPVPDKNRQAADVAVNRLRDLVGHDQPESSLFLLDTNMDKCKHMFCDDTKKLIRHRQLEQNCRCIQCLGIPYDGASPPPLTEDSESRANMEQIVDLRKSLRSEQDRTMELRKNLADAKSATKNARVQKESLQALVDQSKKELDQVKLTSRNECVQKERLETLVDQLKVELDKVQTTLRNERVQKEKLQTQVDQSKKELQEVQMFSNRQQSTKDKTVAQCNKRLEALEARCAALKHSLRDSNKFALENLQQLYHEKMGKYFDDVESTVAHADMIIENLSKAGDKTFKKKWTTYKDSVKRVSDYVELERDKLNDKYDRLLASESINECSLLQLSVPRVTDSTLPKIPPAPPIPQAKVTRNSADNVKFAPKSTSAQSKSGQLGDAAISPPSPSKSSKIDYPNIKVVVPETTLQIQPQQLCATDKAAAFPSGQPSRASSLLRPVKVGSAKGAALRVSASVITLASGQKSSSGGSVDDCTSGIDPTPENVDKATSLIDRIVGKVLKVKPNISQAEARAAVKMAHAKLSTSSDTASVKQLVGVALQQLDRAHGEQTALECVICMHTVDSASARNCPHCTIPYCHLCLDRWWTESGKSVTPTCPHCQQAPVADPVKCPVKFHAKCQKV